jgi:hypothetical protein
MNATDLIDKARAATGLADFGDSTVLEGLEILVRASGQEANLSTAGAQRWEAGHGNDRSGFQLDPVTGPPRDRSLVGEAENQTLQVRVITDCSAKPSLSEISANSRLVCRI